MSISKAVINYEIIILQRIYAKLFLDNNIKR